jgi:hypothetical protein
MQRSPAAHAERSTDVHGIADAAIAQQGGRRRYEAVHGER